jgi:hypothetical protein
MNTTTLIVDKPNDYSILEAQYQLIRYLVPSSEFYSQQDNYQKLHVELKSQLKVPYRHYYYDTLDGPPNVVVYALYPIDEEPIDVVLTFISDEQLEKRAISFADLRLDNLIKLLQFQHFADQSYFASMGAYYVHARSTSDTWHLCLEIDIKGANENVDKNKQEKQIQYFYVSGEAKNFKQVSKKPDEYRKHRYPYYTRQLINSLVVFEQVPFDEIDNYPKEELFEIYRSRSNPARLPYHAQNKTKLQASRGYLLHKFMQSFINELSNYDINVEIKKRTWTRYESEQSASNLEIDQLNHVYLYDNRWNKTTVAFNNYYQLLSEYYTDIEFTILDEMPSSDNQPVLVLQDTDAEDYEDEDGLLFGETDPYKKLYRTYQDVPKQSININPNSQTKAKYSDRNDYLNYEIINLNDEEDEDTDWAMLLQVCLYQLRIKDIVLNQRSVSSSLPVDGLLSTLPKYIYIRMQTYNGTSYKVMMQINEDKLVFTDLREPSGREHLNQALAKWNMNWHDIGDLLASKYHKKEEEYLRRYDVIIMPDKVIELEEVNETVLYDYEELEKRFTAKTRDKPIDEFYLGTAKRYDIIKPTGTLSYNDLEGLGLLDGREPFGDSEEIAMEFYNKVIKYDDLVEDLRKSSISLDELLKIRNKEIAEIFDLPQYKNSDKHYMNYIIGLYRDVWSDFGAVKGDDVQISKGIWFDKTDSSYRVAGAEVFNLSQAGAHRIRRFVVLTGDTDFDLVPFLEATTVKFIRYKQYTVYPYIFYLIDKYIKDVLYHL